MHLQINVVQAQVRFFRRGQNAPVYQRYFTYYSDRIGPEQNNAAIAKWAVNTESLYRSAANRGISEIGKMLNMHLLSPEPGTLTGSPATIKLYDAVWKY
jgi:hypothetical protein